MLIKLVPKIEENAFVDFFGSGPRGRANKVLVWAIMNGGKERNPLCFCSQIRG